MSAIAVQNLHGRSGNYLSILMRKQVTTLQNEKRLRFLGIANILVGVLTAFSALFNFMFYLLQADGDLSRCLIEGGFASVAALLGFLNGFSLLNPRKKAARPLTVSFGIALLIFMIVLAIEGQFNPWPSMIPTTYS